MSKFYAQTVHSDILIHWTGSDFDGAVSDDLYNNPSREHPSTTNEDLNKKYITRLSNILRYGLWVKEDKTGDYVVINNIKFELPKHPRVCFTELKLSESRKHAFKFGRLGIGFKRLFVVGAGGHPVYYLHNQGKSMFFPSCKSELKESRYAFFKRMNSDPGDLNYDLFAESEWRIVYDPELHMEKYFVNPRGNLIEEFNKYPYNKRLNFKDFELFCQSAIEDDRLKLFLPLNGWLAMIIYPSPDVKNIARTSGIHELIQDIKINNPKSISPKYEQEMMPVELDLDLCDHF